MTCGLAALPAAHGQGPLPAVNRPPVGAARAHTGPHASARAAGRREHAGRPGRACYQALRHTDLTIGPGRACIQHTARTAAGTDEHHPRLRGGLAAAKEGSQVWQTGRMSC